LSCSKKTSEISQARKSNGGRYGFKHQYDEKALAAFDKATELNPENETAWYHKALAICL
jgi:hypothetical protein